MQESDKKRSWNQWQGNQLIPRPLQETLKVLATYSDQIICWLLLLVSALVHWLLVSALVHWLLVSAQHWEHWLLVSALVHWLLVSAQHRVLVSALNSLAAGVGTTQGTLAVGFGAGTLATGVGTTLGTLAAGFDTTQGIGFGAGTLATGVGTTQGTLAVGFGAGVLFVCAAWLVITIVLPMTNANTTAKSKIVKRVTFLFVNIWRIECLIVFS